MSIMVFFLSLIFIQSGSRKNQRHSRAYLNFERSEDVVEFAEFFDGHIFVNEKGIHLYFVLITFT